MGFKDDRHATGFGGPGTGGIREGYTPELDSLAEAKYAAELDREATSARKPRLGRIRRVLRRLFLGVLSLKSPGQAIG
jgi:hypothetical protein